MDDYFIKEKKEVIVFRILLPIPTLIFSAIISITQYAKPSKEFRMFWTALDINSVPVIVFVIAPIALTIIVLVLAFVLDIVATSIRNSIKPSYTYYLASRSYDPEKHWWGDRWIHCTNCSYSVDLLKKKNRWHGDNCKQCGTVLNFYVQR